MRRPFRKRIHGVDREVALDRECRIRDAYGKHLEVLRPHEILLRREVRYEGSRLRADMRTVARDERILEWEFKLEAGYEALGQILTYVALARRCFGPGRAVQGVLAAFSFSDDVRLTNWSMNLGLEFVELPLWLAKSGGVPTVEVPRMAALRIPRQAGERG